jgi:hypothetical protein
LQCKILEAIEIDAKYECDENPHKMFKEGMKFVFDWVKALGVPP